MRWYWLDVQDAKFSAPNAHARAGTRGPKLVLVQLLWRCVRHLGNEFEKQQGCVDPPLHVTVSPSKHTFIAEFTALTKLLPSSLPDSANRTVSRNPPWLSRQRSETCLCKDTEQSMSSKRPLIDEARQEGSLPYICMRVLQLCSPSVRDTVSARRYVELATRFAAAWKPPRCRCSHRAGALGRKNDATTRGLWPGQGGTPGSC